MFRSREAIRNLVLSTILALVTVCCSRTIDGKIHGHRAIAAVMDSTELIIDDDPGQAYQLLDSIDSRSIWSRKDRARYCLLYTEALYRNYMPIANDSLIMTSVSYYEDHNNPEALFRSYYYLGCIYSLLNYNTEAVVALSQAERLVNYIESDFRKGMLYLKMGSVFFDSFDFHRAEPYFWKAADYFELSDKDIYRISALFNMGACKMQLNEYEEACKIYDQAIEWAKATGHMHYLSQIMINKLSCLVLNGDSEGVRSEMDEYLSLFGIPEQDSRSLCMLARGYMLVNDRKAARTMLDKAWHTTHAVDSINLFYAESLFQEQLSRPDSALALYRTSISLQNRKINHLLDQPVVGAQRDYYKTVSELEAVKARNKIIILVSAVIILTLIVFSYSLLSRYRKRKAEARIREYLFTIDELTARDSLSQETIQGLNTMLKEKSDSEKSDKETISNLNQRIFELSAWESINKSKIQTLNSKVRDMLRQQFIPSDYLYTRYYEQLDDNKKAERLYRVVKSQIDDFTGSRNIGHMDALLNETFGGIMNKLSSSSLDLQEKELLLLRFVLAGFSAKSIAAILNDSHQNINQRKKRLLDKISRVDPDLMKELDLALNS